MSQYSLQLQNLSMEHLLGVSTELLTFCKGETTSDWKPVSLPCHFLALASPIFPLPCSCSLFLAAVMLLLALAKSFRGVVCLSNIMQN